MDVLRDYIQLIKMVNTTKIGKKILIVGSGGREHALGWKVAQSPAVEKLFFAPGNGGTAQLGENVNISSDNIAALLKFAKQNQIDLTIVGPEDPLSLGIVDEFQKADLKIFGPSKKAAELEASKSWSSKFVEKYGIPAPRYKVFDSYKDAISFVDSCSWGDLVIKADGLAAGKGVVLPSTKDEAKQTLADMMLKGKFKAAGRRVIIQEKLQGEEVSVIAICDGKDMKVLLPAQDHKRVNDEDQGLNTGGMGAYAPVPLLNKAMLDRIKKEILIPTVRGMISEGRPFVGALYAGLMLTSEGPKVLEYNVRFGDPETQPQLVMLKSDLLEHLVACVEGKLKDEKVTFFDGHAVTVILASGGYPEFYTKGQLLHGLDQELPKDIVVFHAGTKLTQGQHFSVGGRVLGITARSKTLKEATDKVYEVINNRQVYFKSMHYRKDIAQRALLTKKTRLVILISGSGTTMESIVKAAQNSELDNIEIVGVISSDKTARGIKRAEKLGVNVEIVDPESSNFEQRLLMQLNKWKPDLISQNGWLPLTPKSVLEQYEHKIINQHPAPLDPEFRNSVSYDFGGSGMYGIVPIASVIKFRKLVHELQPAGHTKRHIPIESTVHLVTENFDEGDVIARQELIIRDEDTPEKLQKRLLPIEHKNVIKAIKDIANGQMKIQKRAKPFIRENERELLIKAKKEAIEKYLNHQ